MDCVVDGLQWLLQGSGSGAVLAQQGYVRRMCNSIGSSSHAASLACCLSCKAKRRPGIYAACIGTGRFIAAAAGVVCCLRCRVVRPSCCLLHAACDSTAANALNAHIVSGVAHCLCLAAFLRCMLGLLQQRMISASAAARCESSTAAVWLSSVQSEHQ